MNKKSSNQKSSEPLKKSLKRLKPIFTSALVIGIITSLFAWYLTWSPAFLIDYQVLKFTDPIIIKSDNSVARKPIHLNVQFDERLYEKQAIPQKSKGRQIWHFWIKDQKYSPGMIKAGKHKIKVGFPGDKMSEEFAIEFKSYAPRFIILNPTLRSDAIMKIKAENNDTNISKALHLEFDSVLFHESGVPVESKSLQIWHCNMQDLQLTQAMKKAGKHKIRFRFPGGNFSEEFAIEFKSHAPRFIILNPTLRSDAIMKIKAENDSANIKKPLHLEFDSVLFPESAIPVNSKDRQIWHCNLRKLHLTPEMKKNGMHKIRFRFPEGDLSKEQTIILLTQKIVVNTELKRENNVNIFRGKTAGKSQIEDNSFKVDVIFYHKGPDNEISVPIQKKRDEATGIIYYEFETKFSGFPEISPEDEEYSQTFFEFRITDKAGNQYRQKQSYAQFIAPGSMLSGSNDWADINIKKKLPKDKANRSLTNIFSFYPNTPNDDAITIHLTVSCHLKNFRHLKWKSNKPKTMTFIYRNGNKIADSNTDDYIDKDVKAGETVSYSVAQENEKGKIFSSNTVRSAAPPEQFAILTIRSNVRNDNVFIDGQKKGSTRIDEKLSIGKHTISVEKKGYKPFEQTINLKKDQVLWAKLKPLPGSLSVTTKPVGAVIYLNGQKRGTAPVKLKDIASGNVEISAELVDYKKQKKSIIIHSEELSSVHFDLEKIIKYFTINVVTNPPGAKIFLNGKQQGVSPVTLTNNVPDNYELKALLTGYLEQVKQIQLKDKNETIQLDLVKQPVITKKYRLRSKPKTLSDDELYKLIDENSWRPKQYIENDYVDNGVGTVTDRATGLMWQQGGSDDYISFDSAKNYINRLNKDKFGGYNDWRLPTLEELISLLENEKMEKNLYINSVFSEKQKWCWTGDNHQSSVRAFIVDFYNGRASWISDSLSFVRAVRSFPDNDG